MTEEEIDAKFEEGMELYQQCSYEAAYDIWTDLAKNGHAKSHYELAKSYFDKMWDVDNNPHSYMHVRFAIEGGWPDTEGLKDQLEALLDDYHKDRSDRLRDEWIEENCT